MTNNGVAGPAVVVSDFGSLYLYSTVVRRCVGTSAIEIIDSEFLAAHSTVMKIIQSKTELTLL